MSLFVSPINTLGESAKAPCLCSLVPEESQLGQRPIYRNEHWLAGSMLASSCIFGCESSMCSVVDRSKS